MNQWQQLRSYIGLLPGETSDEILEEQCRIPVIIFTWILLRFCSVSKKTFPRLSAVPGCAVTAAGSSGEVNKICSCVDFLDKDGYIAKLCSAK